MQLKHPSRPKHSMQPSRPFQSPHRPVGRAQLRGRRPPLLGLQPPSPPRR
ncbi:hypothetical protein H257_00282 [Aphanomyces astaci]|uniref:Uncharacterized protein n=1 Tax=Aphanomyces astaci TaxID=112090 RepID=W4HBX5_APHAT|nr:hypothetical protein H257_00282 [Aphanomyces astaci]ETV88784.1 hypothetical protein H257_00282 [Aphanomyces astaci]|eukprot:XP_009821184.1 hypothetical protein H257_00282 [Aphanomyces astaci]